MAKKKSCLRYKKLSLLNNPFNRFSKRKDVFERYKAEHQDSIVFIDNRKKCSSNGFEEREKTRLEKKLEKDIYANAWQKVNEIWREIKLIPKKAPSEALVETKDNYDISKNKLLFERKRSARNCTENNPSYKKLFDIKDINLVTILENATNNEFMQDLRLLAKENNLSCAHKFREILNEEFKIFSFSRKKKQNCPRLQTVILLDIIGKIYSTEEFHPVVTPALIFIADILGSEFYYSYSNIETRLRVIDIALNYISASKKFIPESLQFLKFALVKILQETVTSEKNPKSLDIALTILRQILHFARLYRDYELFTIIFEPFLSIFSTIPLQLYPSELESNIKTLIEFLGRETPLLRHLSYNELKPKPLKMLEPAFECKYGSLDSYKRPDKDAKEEKNKYKQLKSIKQKIRKEERSVLKGIRRLSKFAASLKLEQKQTLDKERQIKTKNILNELAAQEGEFKKFVKK